MSFEASAPPPFLPPFGIVPASRPRLCRPRHGLGCRILCPSPRHSTSFDEQQFSRREEEGRGDGGSRRGDRRQGAGGGGEDERAPGRHPAARARPGGGLEQAAERGTRARSVDGCAHAPGRDRRRGGLEADDDDDDVDDDEPQGERCAGTRERRARRRARDAAHARRVPGADPHRGGEEAKAPGGIQVGPAARGRRRGVPRGPPPRVQVPHRRAHVRDGEPRAHRAEASPCGGAIAESAPAVRRVHRPEDQHPRAASVRRVGHRATRVRGQGAGDGPAVQAPGGTQALGARATPVRAAQAVPGV